MTQPSQVKHWNQENSEPVTSCKKVGSARKLDKDMNSYCSLFSTYNSVVVPESILICPLSSKTHADLVGCLAAFIFYLVRYDPDVFRRIAPMIELKYVAAQNDPDALTARCSRNAPPT
jgi:hypothetical protein